MDKKSIVSFRQWQMIALCICSFAALTYFVGKEAGAFYILMCIPSAFLWRKKFVDTMQKYKSIIQNAPESIPEHDMSVNMED